MVGSKSMNSPKLPIIIYFIIMNDIVIIILWEGKRSLIGTVGCWRGFSPSWDRSLSLEYIEPRMFECLIERNTFFRVILKETINNPLCIWWYNLRLRISVHSIHRILQYLRYIISIKRQSPSQPNSNQYLHKVYNDSNSKVIYLEIYLLLS